MLESPLMSRVFALTLGALVQGTLAQVPLCKSSVLATATTEAGRKSPLWFQLADSPQQYKPLAIEDGALISKSPWAVDGNHAGGSRTHGSGNLHLLAFAWFPRYPKEPDGDWLPVHCIDLRQATLTVELMHDLALPGNGVQPLVAFWFQNSVPNGSQVVNYAYREPIVSSQQPQELILSSRLDAWQCLGTHDAEEAGRRLYGCATSQDEFDAVLSSASINMGLLALLGTGPRNAIGASGTAKIRRIEIRPKR